MHFCAIALPLVLTAYVLGYFALMNRHRPTSPAGAYKKFQSSFRWASLEQGRKLRSMPSFQTPFPNVTLWNVIYEPMDKIYFRLWPRPYAEVERLRQIGYWR